MNACVAFLLCCAIGSAVAYYPDRQVQYTNGPNDPYSALINSNYLQEPSQRLFWSNGQGSNQVGGTGLWATLTNKFPFLQNMFGKLELAQEYAAPNQISTQYGVPTFQQQYNQVPQIYQTPQAYQTPQTHQIPQFYQTRQYYQQPNRQSFFPARDVGFTDDAVIVTPPQVPIAQPAPAPAPQPAPEPAPQGYQYNKPQYRLDLPHK